MLPFVKEAHMHEFSLKWLCGQAWNHGRNYLSDTKRAAR